MLALALGPGAVVLSHGIQSPVVLGALPRSVALAFDRSLAPRPDQSRSVARSSCLFLAVDPRLSAQLTASGAQPLTLLSGARPFKRSAASGLGCGHSASATLSPASAALGCKALSQPQHVDMFCIYVWLLMRLLYSQAVSGVQRLWRSALVLSGDHP